MTPSNTQPQAHPHNFAVDLTNCDREPIHIPGAVQPHGVLLVLTEPDLTIAHLSENTLPVLGISPEALLGKPVTELLTPVQLSTLQASLAQHRVSQKSLYLQTAKLIHRQTQATITLDVLVHRYQNYLYLELEPVMPYHQSFLLDFYHVLNRQMASLKQAETLMVLCQATVEEIQQITGFDRVMIYRFDAEWNGEVIAEKKRDDMASYLGLHYPASDIPRQARNLYEKNWLRIIPNVAYTPARIVPGATMDLSHAVLRSVSPIHLEYLGNMGVQASMSISLMKNNRLWGLIACLNETPRYVPYELRSGCELLGQLVSLQITAKEDAADYARRLEISAIQPRFVESMTLEENFINGLLGQQETLLSFVNAQGAAICMDGEYALVGQTPDRLQVSEIIAWLTLNVNEDVFATNSLASVFPQAEVYKEVASGLLAFSVSKLRGNYVLWFRPETVEVVSWAGNPQKPTETDVSGAQRISPRKSFERWKETVQLKSLPWKPYEIEAARELRNSIVGIVLKKSEELTRLNTQLQESNLELDAFAHIASHDLKEPLRGIHNYAHFLMDDYGDIINEEGRQRLHKLITLTQRMEKLIDSLLYYSRVGRVELSVRETDLNALIEEILDQLGISLKEKDVEVRIPRPLPTIPCDRVRVGQVFSNLITNALKYNDKAAKWIEIGYDFMDLPMEPGTRLIRFSVSDNGIGIREKHTETIFQIFKRLHARDQFGGGTGAGLSISRKIIERHGGTIWVESVYGQGSTFYFTLKIKNGSPIWSQHSPPFSS